MKRRDFLQATNRAGATLPAVALGLAGCSGHSDPGYVEGYLDSTKEWNSNEGYDNVVDETDTEKVTIDVGAGQENLSFKPVAVEVSLGTTITWKWTGRDGD